MYSPQTRKKLRRGLSVVTGLLIVSFCGLEYSGRLDWLENRSADWRVVSTVNPATADHDIVIVDIDNTSFRVLTPQLGRWPWTRQLWTLLLNYVTRGHPRMVLFDILLSGSEAKVDPGLAAAIRAAGNVVLPFAFTSAEGVDDPGAKPLPPDKALLPVAGSIAGELKKSHWTINAPNPLFAKEIAASGSNLGNSDPDGITRRLPLVEGYNGRNWQTLWLAAAMKLKGATKAEFRDGEFQAGPIRVPVDSKGNYIVRWRGTPATAYKRIPLAEMVCSMQPDICPPDARRHPVAEFQNKIVFVGASAGGSYEVRPLAVSETAPGFFLLASAVDNLLHNDAISRTPEWVTMILILVLTSLPAFSVATYRSITIPMAVTFGALAIYGGACFFAYAHSIWLPMAAPMLGCALSFTANTAFRYLTVDRELSRTRGTLERYVAPQLVSYVLDNLESFRFDGQKRKLTVLFSDVRSFTTLTEKSDPVRLLKQLNEYLEAMTDIIFRYEGIVDKFIGDGIMAHWGAFTPDRPNAALGARAALDMMVKLAELNRHWEATGFPTLDIGIGLNTGEVIFGNVGAGKKLDFTAIGDGVNLAARLESENKVYKTHIIISDATLQELAGAARVNPLGSVIVKGKTVGVEIFELKALAWKDSVGQALVTCRRLAISPLYVAPRLEDPRHRILLRRDRGGGGGRRRADSFVGGGVASEHAWEVWRRRSGAGVAGASARHRAGGSPGARASGLGLGGPGGHRGNYGTGSDRLAAGGDDVREVALLRAWDSADRGQPYRRPYSCRGARSQACRSPGGTTRAGPGGQRRTHAPVRGWRALRIQAARQDARRRGRGSLRQGREAVGFRLSRRSGDRPTGAIWGSASRSVHDRENERKRARLQLQRLENGGAAVDAVERHGSRGRSAAGAGAFDGGADG